MIFLNEKLTRVKVIALVIALIGTAFTVGPSGGQLTGILLAIAAALIYSVYIIIGANVMKHVSAMQSSAVIFASAGGVYGSLTVFNGAHFPSTDTGWLVILAIVLISTVIPVVAFLAGLERIGPTNAAMLSTLEPVVTVLLAAWLFKDALMPITLVGGGLILVAVVLLTQSELKKAEE
jgi:drug/metabolite transporter (DMT)-like permease